MKTIVKLPGRLQKEIFVWQSALIFAMILLLTSSGALLALKMDADSRDATLITIASATSRLTLLQHVNDPSYRTLIVENLDAISGSSSFADAFVLLDRDGIRRYHTNHANIGKKYEFKLPDFSNGPCYVTDDVARSGPQRRANAAIYDSDGNFQGSLIVLVTKRHIYKQVAKVVLLFVAIALGAFLVELFVSYQLSTSIKKSLFGFEPNEFSAMFQLRDSILNELDEGVVVCAPNGKLEYVNQSALELLGFTERPQEIVVNGTNPAEPSAKTYPELEKTVQKLLAPTLSSGKRESRSMENVYGEATVVLDRMTLEQDGQIYGLGVMHDRTEYVKLSDDLTGTKYLVDSMRANNHEFMNKLHVIMGLIRIGKYEDATNYIENAAFVQREGIGKVVRSIDEAAVAALLVGKMANAAELNVSLVLEEGSVYRRNDVNLPSESIVTILGNLITNALDSMNQPDVYSEDAREILVGLHSQPGSLEITVDDSGPGMTEETKKRLFDLGYTTKGRGRGNGLAIVKSLVESLDGEIEVDSKLGEGTSFCITFKGRTSRYVQNAHR